MGAAIAANSDIPCTASQWAIALSERPDDARLRALFAEWLAAEPAHAIDWAEIERTLRVIDRAQPVDRAAWAEFAARRSAGRRRVRAGAVAAFATAVLIALVTGPTFDLYLASDAMTASGEQKTVRLPDGSTVRLAPRSAIAVTRSGRHVDLLKGEAFFQVVHDPSHPFFVQGGDVAVTDIGTAFDIRHNDKLTEVAVREGEVRVDTARAGSPLRASLKAGDWIRVEQGRTVDQGRTMPEDIATWTEGQLIAKNRPVSEVVDALRPYFGGVVVLHGAQLAQQPLTGVYNLSDPRDALYAVARAQGARVRQISPWIIVISGQ